MMLRVMDENRYLLRSNLSGPVPKHEQHGVYDVRLSTPIRSNNGSEALDKENDCNIEGFCGYTLS